MILLQIKIGTADGRTFIDCTSPGTKCTRREYELAKKIYQTLNSLMEQEAKTCPGGAIIFQQGKLAEGGAS